MSLSCRQVRERFARYDEDSLSPEERLGVRQHVKECPSCRVESAAEPGLFFAAIAAEEISPEDAARVLSGVRAGIALKQTERRLGSAPARRRAVAAACAAAIVVFTLALSGGPAARQPRGGERVAGAVKAQSAFLPAAFPPAPEQPRAVSGEKQKSPSNATIYDWNLGGEEPRVVWIVDRSLDI